MTNTPGRTTLLATELAWLLRQPGSITLTTVHHDVLGPALQAVAPDQPPRHTPTTGGPWTHTIPADDLPALRAWLDRLPDTAPIRIGTAAPADGTGLLLTARTGPQAIRIHQPAPTATQETTR
ncbi:hypothetical protein ACWD4P_12750 [Kitasatospora sp. NPDC002543]